MWQAREPGAHERQGRGRPRATAPHQPAAGRQVLGEHGPDGARAEPAGPSGTGHPPWEQRPPLHNHGPRVVPRRGRAPLPPQRSPSQSPDPRGVPPDSRQALPGHHVRAGCRPEREHKPARQQGPRGLGVQTPPRTREEAPCLADEGQPSPPQGGSRSRGRCDVNSGPREVTGTVARYSCRPGGGSSPCPACPGRKRKSLESGLTGSVARGATGPSYLYQHIEASVRTHGDV